MIPQPEHSLDKIHSQFLGLIPYKAGLDWMSQQIQALENNAPQISVGGMEFYPVVSLGRSMKEYPYPLPNTQPPLETFWIDRGGKATLHSPGQLVIYPIIHLKSWGITLKEWVTLLLESTKLTFGRWGITTNYDPQKPEGLYHLDHKIAFIGLRVKNHICYHGLAINLGNDLSLFNGFESCGVLNRKMTSLKNLLREKFQNENSPSPQAFFDQWLIDFENKFTAQITSERTLK